MARMTNGNRGFVSLLILLLISFLSWQGMKAFYQTTAQERRAVYEAQLTAAVYLADSGFEWAIAELRNDNSWEGGIYHLNDGVVTVTVLNKTDPTPSETVYTIVTEAQYRGAEQKRSGEIMIRTDGHIALTRYAEVYN